MRFEEILPALREGKKITKASWWEGHYVELTLDGIIDQDGRDFVLNRGDLICDDWEIVKEKKKVKLRDLTAKQYKTFVDRKCGNQMRGIGCVGCPFYHISCLYGKDNRCRIDNKDLYSNKFLDQEIEIGEE